MKAIFLDLETTGLDPFRHRVLEIAFKIVDPKTGEVKSSYQRVVKQSPEVWEKRDPMSVEINGFTWEKILTGMEEASIREEIIELFTEHEIVRGKAFYVCQNPAFDRGFFSQIIDVYTQENHHWPYHWLDFASMYWALQVKKIRENGSQFPSEINLSKNSIAEHYQLPIESIPHTAINGVSHLILCYQTVVGFLQNEQTG